MKTTAHQRALIVDLLQAIRSLMKAFRPDTKLDQSQRHLIRAAQLLRETQRSLDRMITPTKP